MSRAERWRCPPFNAVCILVTFADRPLSAGVFYTRVKNNSLDIVLELRSEEWGQRHFSVKDPNGAYVDIVQAIESSEDYQEGYNDKQKLD